MTQIPHKIALGKDWSILNPLDFFNIKFFIFNNAIGGHANTPPRLECILSPINSIDSFVHEVKELVKLYSDSNITISKNEENLKIEFFEWELYDYEFQLAEKIEDLIEKYNLNSISKTDNYNFEEIFQNRREDHKNGYFLETKTNLSRTSSRIYFDCNLKITSETEFIEHIKSIFNNFELDELKFSRKLIYQNVQFRISFIKHKTILSQNGKYVFDIHLLDNKLYQVCKDLNVTIGTLKDSYSVKYEVLLFTKKN
ncbi:hypothetical protein [Flavobacterium sp. LC2016-01]|uniref:hypothetical protein n=1 Tax=Flavobacterium sp. LC2016-01 TaxID=2675876 RepID=UPI0012BA939F|nr:hypothetical protein [Flavobacterium sp. LC2016-01]MTH14268.1 hypothetical protein [Flavobacterium sp. LC2016-01]